ncbi:MAG: hypothetical protein C5B48_15260 [Candidatus Rokuibacteriota bacterium]|nr:MAG: hypothetical protein C5B48_15260 [Candidatus Rokubacteria bacterium]
MCYHAYEDLTFHGSGNRVHIGAVEFSDFRNFHSLSFSPAANLNILSGPNAQGKTNLLEGLGVLMVGRSFRGARVAELPRWGCPQSAVRGHVWRRDDVRVMTRLIQPRDDGVWSVTGEGSSWARVVPFGWTDLAILHGGPQARRDFVDGFTAKLYPAHATAYRRYRQILQRRNRLLQGSSGGSSLRAGLEPWNDQLISVGMEILSRRRIAVDALEQEVARLYRELAGHGQVALRYQSSLGFSPTDESFRSMLDARFGEEVRRGLSVVGPHRDDLLIDLDGRDVRRFGSRGQQRLMALTLRLSEAGPVAEAVGSAPVLLLDDALSELDPGVQARVLEHIARAGQVFLTTAEATLPDAESAIRWEVHEGRVRTDGVVVMNGAA